MAIALERPTLITPGLKPVDPSFESWWVRPGGATVVHVRPGDRLCVRDPDGGQPAEVTVLDAEGGEDAAALGARADAPASVIVAALQNGSGAPFLGELHRRGLKPHDARAIRLFGTDSPPGASESFTAARAAPGVVGAAGGGGGGGGGRAGGGGGRGRVAGVGADGRVRARRAADDGRRGRAAAAARRAAPRLPRR